MFDPSHFFRLLCARTKLFLSEHLNFNDLEIKKNLIDKFNFFNVQKLST